MLTSEDAVHGSFCCACYGVLLLIEGLLVQQALAPGNADAGNCITHHVQGGDQHLDGAVDGQDQGVGQQGLVIDEAHTGQDGEEDDSPRAGSGRRAHRGQQSQQGDDHQLHGREVVARAARDEDRGDHLHDGGAQAMLQDIRTVNRKIHAYYPELPLILMGHSMGSLAVRAFVAEHDSCVDMLIVCGSPSYNTAMPLGVAIAKTEKAVFGPRHRSKLIETMSFGAGAMKFRKDKRCTAWICSDPDVAKEYEESELCGFTFTDDAYLALFELMKRAYDVEHFSCTNPDMPVLFVSGAEDPCLINVRHFAKTVRAMRRAGYKDVKGKLYPGMRHEILNEIGREQVYHDIAVYMRKKGF